MAVALDGTGSPNFVTGGVTVAGNLTVSSSATSLLAMVTVASTTIVSLTVTWNSSTQALTQLAIANSTGATNTQVSLWGLLSPASGAHLVVATWSGAQNVAVEGVSFFNTASDTLGNCFKNLTTNTNAGQLPSVTVTSQSSDMAVGLFGSASTVDSVDNNQIYIQNNNAAKSGANQAAGAASVTLGASTAASAAWAAAGVDVSQAAGAATTAAFQGPSWTALPTRYIFIGA